MVGPEVGLLSGPTLLKLKLSTHVMCHKALVPASPANARGGYRERAVFLTLTGE